MNVSQLHRASEILMLLARQGKWPKTLYYTTGIEKDTANEHWKCATCVKLDNDIICDSMEPIKIHNGGN